VSFGGSKAPSGIGRHPSPGSVGKSGKWQPLSSVELKADLEDHDPFSLGDSDEELDAKREAKATQDKGEVSKTASEAGKTAGKTAGGNTASSAKPASDGKGGTS
jgi:hypothetical protein